MHLEEQYTVYSLELHLFFARIMKEHSLFLMAAFTPTSTSFTKRAMQYKNEFESLLSRAVTLADGVVNCNILNSGEIVTCFTAVAEEQTSRFTGIQINNDITSREKKLRPAVCNNLNPCITQQVRQLNRMALRLLDGLIDLKEQILSNVLCCKMFTMNYPLLLEHIIREAKLYREYVCRLEEDGNLDPQTMGELEQFWNQIMMEHALFIRGLLDPSENELIETANSFAEDFKTLLTRACEAHDKTILHKEALVKTEKLRDFKTAGVKGIEECKIRSVILPLLADHVLREANHYLRLLENC